MNLVLFQENAPINLLPCDGTVWYYGKLLSHEEATYFKYILLETLAWKHDEAIIFGKHLFTQRKVCWYADSPFSYSYSKITRTALPWTPALLTLKQLVEEKTQEQYNACLLNLYHDGNEGMAWHSDDEKELGKNAAIASLSLGAARKFAFKHKTLPLQTSLVLENGSLLLMKDETQSHWLHAIPKAKRIKDLRINLTFRKMLSQQ